MKYIDLFCGIGSFHYSFKKKGHECVMACDINKDARDTYKKNYNIDPLGDITKIDTSIIPYYDILCAGFPCQSFSQAGKSKGFDDERGQMFFEIMRFVNAHQPKIIFLENVKALLTHDSGNTLNTIINHLTVLYNVEYKLLVCSDYGIPQMRKRLFIVCVRKDVNIDIHKILDVDKYKKDCNLSTFFNKNFEKKIGYTIRCGGKKSPIHDKHNWDGYIVDGKEYRLTIQDALRLQGYDETFKLSGTENQQWKQLGNTIPTIFTEMLVNNLDCVFNLGD
jgi:DNA (cytosine-5)-methyltransferase 1